MSEEEQLTDPLMFWYKTYRVDIRNLTNDEIRHMFDLLTKEVLRLRTTIRLMNRITYEEEEG